MKKIILSFIPDQYKENEETNRKAKLFVNLCFITPIFSLFYFATSSFYNMDTVSKAMVFHVIGFPLLPFLLKKKVLSLNVLANLFILIGTIGILIIVLHTGGLKSSILPWLSLMPLASLMLINKKSGWFWTFTTYFTITAIGYFTLKEFQFPDETSPEILTIFNTTNLNGLGVFGFLIAIVFENTKNTALKNLDDRNNQLQNEKKRSDDLLLNILPLEIVAELKENGKSKARYFENVTVLFTDFVDFTVISESLSPEELVAEIDTCFSHFDEIIEKNGLEKIKTIGDAYLAVCGLPNEDKNHATNTIQAAIEIVDYIKDRKAKGGKFDIRVGINTGSLIAGIVGTKKFAYDIWGDTVNTASRLESSGEKGKINISASTHSLIKDRHICTYRGKIEAKNKGFIEMYFVENA